MEIVKLQRQVSIIKLHIMAIADIRLFSQRLQVIIA